MQVYSSRPLQLHVFRLGPPQYTGIITEIFKKNAAILQQLMNYKMTLT